MRTDRRRSQDPLEREPDISFVCLGGDGGSWRTELNFGQFSPGCMAQVVGEVTGSIPGQAYAWVAGQIPSLGHARGN